MSISYYIQLIINGIALGSVYSLIALGFTLIFSVLKFSNFSHGGVMVVSAYFAYIACKNWNLGFIPMILITVIFGGLLSCTVQYLGFERLRKTKGSSMLFFVSSSNLGTLLQNIVILMFASSYYSYPSFFSKSFFQLTDNLTIAVTDLIMLGLLEVFSTNFVGSSLAPAMTFLFAIIFLIFRPQGISGKFTKEKV